MTTYFPLGGQEKFYIHTDKGDYHLLEFNIVPDNRFTPETCVALVQALTYIKEECEAKPLVTTSTTPKFYSNGLDFERAISTPGFFDWGYYAVMRAMLEFPWPTIALVNGHAFAAGFTFSLCHDIRVMNPKKGFMCMNEVEFGAPMPTPMMSILRVKLGYKYAGQATMFATRFTGPQAHELGFVDALGGIEVAEDYVAKLGKFANAPSYGALRKELYRDVLDELYSYDTEQDRVDVLAAREAKDAQRYLDQIAEYKRSNKSKL